MELIHQGREVFLKMIIPEGALQKLHTEKIGTHNLEMTRLSEEGYENPDGTPLMIDRDFLLNEIGENPVPGPLQCLKEGENCIKIWGW